MGRMGWRWAFALIAVSVLVSSCTGSDDDTDGAAEPDKVTTSLPPECAGVGSVVQPEEDEPELPSTTTTLPADCSNAVFIEVVSAEGSKELTELDEDQLLGFGYGICSYGRALTSAPESAPTYDDLVTSTADSWGVSGNSVEEVLGFASTLCPGDLDVVIALRDDVGAVTVQMTVTGANPVQVTYTLPEGDSLQDEVEAPWESQVILDPVSDFTLTVSSSEGEVECSISVKDEELVTATARSGEATTCAATSAELREAAR